MKVTLYLPICLKNFKPEQKSSFLLLSKSFNTDIKPSVGDVVYEDSFCAYKYNAKITQVCLELANRTCHVSLEPLVLDSTNPESIDKCKAYFISNSWGEHPHQKKSKLN